MLTSNYSTLETKKLQALRVIVQGLAWNALLTNYVHMLCIKFGVPRLLFFFYNTPTRLQSHVYVHISRCVGLTGEILKLQDLINNYCMIFLTIYIQSTFIGCPVYNGYQWCHLGCSVTVIICVILKCLVNMVKTYGGTPDFRLPGKCDQKPK